MSKFLNDLPKFHRQENYSKPELNFLASYFFVQQVNIFEVLKKIGFNQNKNDLNIHEVNNFLFILVIYST